MRSIIETASMAKRRTRNDHGKAFGIYGDQLTANQFDKLNWNTLRKAITTPGGKRLYVFLRSREGFRALDGFRLYENVIDRELVTTQGCAHLTPRDAYRAMLQALSAEPEWLASADSIAILAGRFCLAIPGGRD